MLYVKNPGIIVVLLPYKVHGEDRMSTETIYVLLRSRDNDELYVQGSPELAARFMRAFFQDDDDSITKFETVVQNTSIPGFLTKSVHDDRNVMMNSEAGTTKPDFLTFYRLLSPSNQTEQVLTITYFYQRYGEMESLSLEEYDQAYTLLQRVPVEKPSNLKSSVRNVVDRTKYLRNADRGRYMLTLIGEELIEQLLKQSTP